MHRPTLQSLLRLAFFVLLVAVFVVCMIPVPEGLMVFSWQDKVEHVLSFGCLAALGFAGWPARLGRLAAGLILYGALIEFAQSLITWRSGDLLDWLADSAGVLLGFGLARLWRRLQGVPGTI